MSDVFKFLTPLPFSALPSPPTKRRSDKATKRQKMTKNDENYKNYKNDKNDKMTNKQIDK